MKGIRVAIFQWVALCVMVAWNLQGAQLENWHWRNPLPQGNSLRSVAYANGGYIAVGELGTILTSSDGTNWTARVSGTTADLRDCAYGGGKYVAVGAFGTVLTSADGVVWAPRFGGTFYSLNGVTYGNGKFIAVGEQATIVTSVDGENWTSRSAGAFELYDVIYAEGQFVAAGGSVGSQFTQGTQIIVTSPDTVAWTTRVLRNGGPFVSLAAGNGRIAALSRTIHSFGNALWTSENGVDWEPSLLPSVFYQAGAIGFGNGKWTAAFGTGMYDGLLMTSANLSTWTTNVMSSVAVTGIAYGDKLVAARADGTFLVSTDGTSWANPLPERIEAYWINDLQYLNGQFVALDYSGLLTSSDGAQWTRMPNWTNTEPIRNIAYGNGLYVAGSEYRTIRISTDLVTWTNPAPETSIAPYVSDMVVAFGKGVFVAAGGYDGDILTSSDGTNWMTQQLDTNATSYVYWRDIAYGNDRFVVVSENSTATSMDGTNWVYAPQYNGFFSVAAGKGLFVAVGSGVIGTSSDGTNWTTINSNAFGNLSDVAFGGGVFVAVTVNYFNNSQIREESAIWTSTDGFSWSRGTIKTARSFNRIAFGNSTFVIGGELGVILQSDPILNLTIGVERPPRIQVFGRSEQAYRIEYRETLNDGTTWKELVTVPANGPDEYVDTGWTEGTQRFYRAAPVP